MEQGTDQFLNKINVKYKILSVNNIEHSVVVRYWTDFLSEEELKINDEKSEDGSPLRCRTDSNLNIWDHIKTEEELHEYIIGAAPIEWFKLMYKGKYPELFKNRALNFAQSLINKKHEKDVVLKERDLTEVEIETLLEKLMEDQTVK